MKAIEMRVGNLVFSELSVGKPTKVEAMDILAVAQCEAADTPVEFISPILLTDEWLTNYGFEPNGVFKSMRLPIEPLRTHGSRTFIVVAYDGGAWIEIINRNVHNQYKELQSPEFQCKYVHQLQNLYFSLTGKEL